jgi:hypothetical protein
MSQDKESSEVIQDLESLIEQEGNPRKTSEPTERFWLTHQNLNTLALSTTTITRTQANEGIVMASRKKLSVRMEPGNQYRNGAKMKCLMMTSRWRLKYLPQRMF